METKNPAIRYLLKIDKEFSIHQRNLRAFFSPPLMNSLFVFTNNENVRQFQILSTGLRKTYNYGLILSTGLRKTSNYGLILSTGLRKTYNYGLILSTGLRKTYNYGLERVIYKASTNWAKLTSKYKLAISLQEFKIKIKTSKFYICPCRLGKKFQPNLGFVDQGV